MKIFKNLLLLLLLAVSVSLAGKSDVQAVTIDTNVAPVLYSVSHQSFSNDKPELYWDYTGSAYRFNVYRNGAGSTGIPGSDSRLTMDPYPLTGYNTYTVTATGDNGESVHSNSVTVGYNINNSGQIPWAYTTSYRGNVGNKYWGNSPMGIYFGAAECPQVLVNTENQAYPSCNVLTSAGAAGHVTLPIKYDVTSPTAFNVSANYTSYKSQGTTYYNINVVADMQDNSRIICNNYAGEASIVGVGGATGVVDCETKKWTASLNNFILSRGNHLLRVKPLDVAGNFGSEAIYTLNIK